MPLRNKPFENTVGKGEIARYEQFLLYPQCFLPVKRTYYFFHSNLKLSSADYFILDLSKILSFGNGFNPEQQGDRLSCRFAIELSDKLNNNQVLVNEWQLSLPQGVSQSWKLHRGSVNACNEKLRNI